MIDELLIELECPNDWQSGFAAVGFSMALSTGADAH